MVDRRGVLSGLSATALAAPAWAAKPKTPPVPEAPLFKTGILSQNAIGKAFTVPAKPLLWPKYTDLWGPDGKRARIETLRGKLILIDLWAEWCTPCIRELAGVTFQKVRATTPNFEIIAICTGTKMFKRPAEVQPILDKIGASKLASWLDTAQEDSRLIDKVCITAEDPDESSVPCMLLMDHDGVIRGHVSGGFEVTVEQGVGAGRTANAWATTAASEFAAALGSGELPGI